ncbi:hypothetical protein BJ978_001244 [Agromyces terreus]|uniref:Uridine kinase n=1 Tax=Agromyces terreus TaxID=424795 RepID=A0A9X2KAQ2_9MICO|nr:hypothetical protein [Agromyces terreus]MCP2370568.1 hypothetical protein [Agromyces terreus]
MTETTDAARELFDGVAAEFLHLTPRGRRLVAVEGLDAARAAWFADGLAGALGERGQQTARRSLGDVDEASLRSETVEPFRAGTLDGANDADTVLVVDGRRLLNERVRGIWHFTVWVLVGEELPHAGVNVIVDATLESAPKRFFYDYCALPPSVGELR